MSRRTIVSATDSTGTDSMTTRFGHVRVVQQAAGASADGGSTDSTGAELDADARADAAGSLGDGVFPRALAGAAHDDEVAVAQGIADGRGDRSAGRARARAQGEDTRLADREDGDHRVFGVAAADAVAVPGDAVATVAVEAQGAVRASRASSRIGSGRSSFSP